jgi:hypothetical protein
MVGDIFFAINNIVSELRRDIDEFTFLLNDGQLVPLDTLPPLHQILMLSLPASVYSINGDIGVNIPNVFISSSEGILTGSAIEDFIFKSGGGPGARNIQKQKLMFTGTNTNNIPKPLNIPLIANSKVTSKKKLYNSRFLYSFRFILSIGHC